MLAANAHGRRRGDDTFEDRFPAPQFGDRFPTANESLAQRQSPGRAAHALPRTVRAGALPGGVARRPTLPLPASGRREEARPCWSA